MSDNPTAEEENPSLIYARDDVPPVPVTALQALQTLLLIIAPITITPIVVYQAAGLDPSGATWLVFASLIASGITSYVQIKRFGPIGSGYLIYMGSTGTFIAVAIEAARIGGWPLVAVLCVASAPIQLLFGRFLGFFRHILTPMVGGVTITLIVVAVLPVAFSLIVGPPSLEHEEQVERAWIAGSALLVAILLGLYAAPKWRMWAPLAGMVVGLIVAAGLGALDLSRVRDASWIGLPDAAWPGIDLGFSVSFWVLLPSFLLVTLVGAVETVGDTMAVQRISNRKYRKVDYESVQGALYADGLGNAFAGALGTMPNTSYSNTISLSELTGVASRRVGYWVAAGLLILAFFPKLAAFLVSIPGPILGGFLFFLLAMLFITGLRMIAQSGFPFQSTIIVGASFWIGYAFQNNMVFPDLIPESMRPFFGNGMAVGGFSALIFSWLYELRPRRRARLELTGGEADLPRLSEWLETFAKRGRLSARDSYALQLAGEEIFLHCQRETEGVVPVKLWVGSDRSSTLLEVISGSDEISDVDFLAEEYAGVPVNRLSPESMGITLLAKVVPTLEHRTIGGVQYITVEIPRSSKPVRTLS